MNIILKRLTLTNFKGIKSRTIDFDKDTNIIGDNGTGKTTIMDAFTWLYYGKDSSGRKDFNIKTLDKDNIAIPKLDHEVIGEFMADNNEVVLRRLFREKYVKKHGSEVPEMTGHETLFYWNDVPMQAGEYQAKINGLVEETLFKLLTNPLYFNSIKWQDRRSLLVSVVGGENESELLTSKPEYKELMDQLSNKSIDELKREIASKKKKLNDDLRLIPARIDEVSRNTPEDIPETVAALNESLMAVKSKDEHIRGLMTSQSKAFDAFSEKQRLQSKAINDLKAKLQRFELDAETESNKGGLEKEKEINNCRNSISLAKSDLSNAKSQVKVYTESRATINTEQEALREKFSTIANSHIVFNEEHFACPTCKRDFDDLVIDEKKIELTNNFNADKSAKLEAINTSGKALGTRLERINKIIDGSTSDVERIEARILELNSKLSTLENSMVEKKPVEHILSNNTEYAKIKAQIDAMQSAPVKDFSTESNNFDSELNELKEEEKGIDAKLKIKESIAKSTARIVELQYQEKNISQQIATLEKTEFLVSGFIKDKIDHLEGKINSLFKNVKFKLFDTQINGGLVECCDSMVDGVPYPDLNTANKINSGLEVIKVLNEHFSTYAPIFVDNSESVVNLISAGSQMIRLIVSGEYKTLTVI